MLRRWLITSAVKWLDRHYLNRDAHYKALVLLGQSTSIQAELNQALLAKIATLEAELVEERRKNGAIASVIGDALSGVRAKK